MNANRTIELQLIHIMLSALSEATQEYRAVLKHAPEPERIAGLKLATGYDGLITATTHIYDLLIEEAPVLQAIEDERERCRNYRKHSHG